MFTLQAETRAYAYSLPSTESAMFISFGFIGRILAANAKLLANHVDNMWQQNAAEECDIQMQILFNWILWIWQYICMCELKMHAPCYVGWMA